MNSSKSSQLEISAISKTLFIFDNLLGKVSIPINLNRLDDKKEWYYLKNNRNENVISVLTSIYCEFRSERSLIMNNSFNINNNSFLPTYKNDLSYDLFKGSSVYQTHNNTQAHPNIAYAKMSNILNNINNYSMDEGLRSKSKQNPSNSHIFNEKNKSPDLSMITNNIMSPYSYRLEDKKNFKYNLINITNIGNKKNNEINCNILSDSFLDLNLYDQNYVAEHPEIILKIKNKICLLREEQEKLKKFSDDVIRNNDKINQREKILLKEKEKLENHIKNFKTNKLNYENRSNMLNQNYTKFKTELEKFNKEKEIFNYQKDQYFQLNYLLSTGKTITNSNYNEDKINEINNKLQINNLALPVPSVGTNTNNNKNLKFIKKEILVEKPKNVLFSERSNKKEKQTNKDDKINRSSNDMYNKINDKTNISLYSGSSSNLTNALDNYFSGNSGEITSNNNLNIQKILNNSNNITKFYTPIAKIDLNNKRYSNGETHYSTCEQPSPTKAPQDGNKLIDSLDNFNSMLQANKNLNDKRNQKMNKKLPEEFTRGSYKKIDEKKKMSNKINSNLINVSNINYSKDKERKSTNVKSITNAYSEKNFKKELQNSNTTNSGLINTTGGYGNKIVSSLILKLGSTKKGKS